MKFPTCEHVLEAVPIDGDAVALTAREIADIVSKRFPDARRATLSGLSETVYRRLAVLEKQGRVERFGKFGGATLWGRLPPDE